MSPTSASQLNPLSRATRKALIPHFKPHNWLRSALFPGSLARRGQLTPSPHNCSLRVSASKNRLPKIGFVPHFSPSPPLPRNHPAISAPPRLSVEKPHFHTPLEFLYSALRHANRKF
jgi:hypothetical protein